MMSEELLLLSGWKINKLMSQMEANEMASYMAHLSPNVLQWIKKQVKSCSFVQHCKVTLCIMSAVTHITKWSY